MAAKNVLRKFSTSLADLLSITKKDYGNEEQRLLLHNAVKCNDILAVKNLISSKVIEINEQDIQGRAPLHLSILFGSTESTSLLLKAGANVDVSDFEGCTPCHLACRYGMIDHFHLLIYYGVNVCSIDKSGRTPFDAACEHGQEKMVETILNCGIQRKYLQLGNEHHTASSLQLAACNGHVEIIHRLLYNSWNLNETTSLGSALHMAAGYGQIQVVRYLLNAGIDITIKNSVGQTSYQFTKKRCSRNPVIYAEIRFLLKNYHTFFYVTAINDVCGESTEHLDFSIGDKIWVIDRDHEKAWKGIVFGMKGLSRSGYFSSDDVKEIHGKIPFCRTMKALTKKCQSERFLFPENKKAGIFAKNHSLLSLKIRKNDDLPEITKSHTTLDNNEKSKYFGVDNFNCVDVDSVHGNHDVDLCDITQHCKKIIKSTISLSTNQENLLPSTMSSSSRSTTNLTDLPSFPSLSSFLTTPLDQLNSTFPNGSSFSISTCGDSRLPFYQKLDDELSTWNIVNHEEIMTKWLDSMSMNFYLTTFLEEGYDLYTLARCTPADLLNVGVKNPGHRETIMKSIKNWNIKDNWPTTLTNDDLSDWLISISLSHYIPIFENQNYSKVSQIVDWNWEDFADIGIKRQGHLKCLGLAIKKLKANIRVTQSNCREPSNNKNLRLFQQSSNGPTSLIKLSHRFDISIPALSIGNEMSSEKSNGTYSFCSKEEDLKLVRQTSQREILLKGEKESDTLFDEFKPIRLNLVQTCKFLKSVSDIKAEGECESEYVGDHPTTTGLSWQSSDNIFPLVCKTESENKNVDRIDFPSRLPPLLIDDFLSDFSTVSNSVKPCINDIHGKARFNSEK